MWRPSSGRGVKADRNSHLDERLESLRLVLLEVLEPGLLGVICGPCDQIVGDEAFHRVGWKRQPSSGALTGRPSTGQPGEGRTAASHSILRQLGHRVLDVVVVTTLARAAEVPIGLV